MSDLPAISLFSGVGGLDLGVERAGFDVRTAVEFDRDSAASLRENHFKDQPDRVFERSIIGLPTAEILDRAGLRVGDASLVVGGPPCTPFSKSGNWLEYKRTGNDPDASLLDEFARVAVEAEPAAILMENVWGLAYNNHNAAPLSRLVAKLEDGGYRVAWRVLNAADYGVPQLRKRMILYATRGAEPPEFPTPTHSGWTENSKRVDASLAPYVTSRQKIGDLAGRDDLTEPDEAVNGRYGALLPDIPPGENYLFYTEKRGHPEPLFRWRSRYWTFLLKLDPERPSTTIQSQPGPYIGPFHWDNRRLRLLETKRLMAFPDGYVVVARNRRSWQHQLGNAVPPDLAEIVARPLADYVAKRDRQPVAIGVESDPKLRLSIGSGAGKEVGMPSTRRNVVPDPDGGWKVTGGGDRASAHTDTQAEAIDRARQIVGNLGGGEVTIHGRDGRIRDSDTVPPGGDPNPPKDRR